MAARSTLPLLAGANFAAASAGMIIAGVLQLIAMDLHWSPAQAGRLITLYALGFAIGAPILGAALGTWCRKQVVILGLTLVATGSLLTALATQSIWIELSRMVVAAGAAMTIPSVSAIAAYLYPQSRPRALGFAMMGVTLAMVLGLPIGTFIAGVWGWHAPLFVVALIAAATALAIKVFLEGGIVVPPVPLAAWRQLLFNPKSYPLLGLSIIVVAATFTLYAYIAPFLVEMLGVRSEQLSLLLLWYGVSSLAAGAVLGWLSLRVGDHRLMILSLVGLVLALALTQLIEHHLWLIILLFASWAIASSFFGTLQQARVAEAAPGAGTALLALNTSANFAGQALGTLVGGWIIASLGLRALPAASGSLALAGLLLFLATRHVRVD